MRVAVKCISVLLAALIGFSCSAPRNNPLDPANPSTTSSYLDGTVLSDARTPLPLAGVSVSWQGSSLATLTDANGKFSLGLPKMGNGYVLFSKSAYVTDSTVVDWAGKSEYALTHFLHAIPQLDSFRVWSIVRNKYSGIDNGLETQVTVRDEHDIDSVFLVCPALNIREALDRLSSTSFHSSFLDFELGLSSLNQMIGRTLAVQVREQGGSVYTVGSTMITRIIDQEIETISPKNQDTVTSVTPTLRWKRFIPGFTFSYKLEVYTNETEPKLQWTKSGISSDSISTVVLPALITTPTNNSFYWTISCVDEFNNSNRSKPSSFVCDTGIVSHSVSRSGRRN